MQNCKSKFKIIFMGTPIFGATILSGLINNGYRPILVVTELDKPAGRRKILTPPPVKVIARKYNLSTVQPQKIENCKATLRGVRLGTSRKIENLSPDLIVVAAYGQILPKEILKIPKYGSLNIHPSLLPKYRGPSPIQTTILNGDKETGVTIILMDEKIDHGKIISNIQYPISNKKITYPELSQKLAELGVKLLIDTIPRWINDEITAQSQDDSKATYTKTLKKEDGKINWEKSAKETERQIRAFNPWPGAFTFWRNKRIKILQTKVVKPTKPCGPPGKTFLDSKNKLCVCCGKDSLIIEELQIEGKKPVNSEDFLRGHSEFLGVILR